MRGDLRRLFTRTFGAGEECARGGFGLRESERWGDTTGVYWTDAEGVGYCVVEVTGGMLALLDHAGRVELIRAMLELGCKVTRIDLAVDWRGECSGMIREVYDACQRAELVHAKRFRTVDECAVGEEGTPTVYIGRRGSAGSGRMVRLYDKGVESKTAGPGEWVRWETEFSDAGSPNGPAQQIAAMIVKNPTNNALWHAHALGAVDFRLSPGKRLDRRARAPWFTWWLRAWEPVRVTAQRLLSSLDQYAGYLRRQVAPGLVTFARAAGVEVGELFAYLAGEVNANPKLLKTLKGRQFSALIPELRPALSGGPPG